MKCGNFEMKNVSVNMCLEYQYQVMQPFTPRSKKYADLCNYSISSNVLEDILTSQTKFGMQYYTMTHI